MNITYLIAVLGLIIFLSLSFYLTRRKKKEISSHGILIKRSKEKKRKNSPLNPSTARHISLPKIAKPNFDEGRKPQEYWQIYNKGLSFYNRKWYEKAKVELLKLLNFENPHNAAYTYLLRTYRKIIKKYIEKEKLKDAYRVFEEFFINCKGHITNTDRRNFNKIVDKLLKKSPNSDYEKIDLIRSEEVPDFEIFENDSGSIKYQKETKTGKKSILPQGKWDFIGQVGSGMVYIKRTYNSEKQKYDKSFVMVKNVEGHINKEFDLDHGIYRFKSSEESSKFVVSSVDLMLYLYSTQGNCLKTYDLNKHSESKYHVRCVDISPEGNFLLFTCVDKAYLTDSNLKLINNWKTPIKEGWEARTSDRTLSRRNEYQRDLSILGLSGQPTYEEIKKAFRIMLLKHHPDKNPGDSTATEKTIEIKDAYEKLTGEEARLALEGIENAEYYFKLMDRIEVNIPGTPISFNIEIGMIGPGEDWIYATCLGTDAERIYLGCYSGKVYSLSKNGFVEKLYICHDVIKSIREDGKYLFIETDYNLFIVKEDKYLAHIDTWGVKRLLWGKNNFILIKEKEIHIFSNDGIEVGNICIKNSILDVFWHKNDLNVFTARKTYLFLVC